MPDLTSQDGRVEHIAQLIAKGQWDHRSASKLSNALGVSVRTIQRERRFAAQLLSALVPEGVAARLAETLKRSIEKATEGGDPLLLVAVAEVAARRLKRN